MNKTTLFLLLGVGAAWALGGSRKSKAAGSGPHFEPDGPGGPTGNGAGGELPISDRMLFDEQCRNLVVRVNMEAYDKRITELYWNLRQNQYCNPGNIAAEILRMDAPQCAWPPGPDASEQAKIVWEGTFQAVSNYMSMEDPKLHEAGLVRPCF